MRRLFRKTEASPDMRPALFSVVALMVLLLPFLLMTTSAQKLAGLTLGLPGPDEELPPETPGPVEDLRVERVPEGYRVSAAIRATDVLAGIGDTEQKVLMATDLTKLQQALLTFKRADPKRERITLVPAPDTPTEEVVRWMAAVRAGPEGPLYPQVIMQATQPPEEQP